MEINKWKIKALQFQIKCYQLEKKELEKRVSKLEQQMDYIIHLKNEYSHKEEIYDETDSEEAYDYSDDEILLADKEKLILPPTTRSKDKVNKLE